MTKTSNTDSPGNLAEPVEPTASGVKKRSGRTRVAVIYGGQSSEHSISCVSAGSVLAAIDASRYDVIPIGITRAGAWVSVPGDPEQLKIVDRVLPEVDSAGDLIAPIFGPEPGFQNLVTGERFHVDVIFPVLHGPWGEDGTIQGVFEMLGIPYVGAGVLASAAGMDKIAMRQLFAGAGLPQVPWIPIERGQWQHQPTLVQERVNELGWPVFVKPARAGSSMGISKVHRPDDLAAAMELALAEDPKVLVEAAVPSPREIELGVLGQGAGRRAIVSGCAEIKLTSTTHEFYDFEAKYLDDAADLLVPAPVSLEQLALFQELALKAFEAVDGAGLARVDFLLGTRGEIVLNEINTMPGFTPISMYPRVWAQAGIDYPQLIDELLSDALSRGVGLR